MPQVEVKLPNKEYEVKVENKCIHTLVESLDKVGLSKKKCAIITDSNVAKHYLELVIDLLEDRGIPISAHIVPAGEKSKSLRVVEKVSREMIRARHDRSSFVIALGGGVVGDLAGFVASIFYRGIPFVQIPTTIVSQVDSSVGGKTGVNTGEGKNLIGAFHQPEFVLIDPLMLKSLPRREYLEGYAEVIKHACIRDREMVADLESLDIDHVPPPADLLARNIAIKARVVEEDEKETTGTRALLNFGHTIGHGIEASVPYGELLHGEAIALGMRAALYLSVKHGGMKQTSADRVVKLLKRFSLPVTLSKEITTEQILEKMKTDKKFAQGQVHFVLLSSLGRAYVSADLTMDDLEEAIEAIREPFEEQAEEEDSKEKSKMIKFVGGMVATNGYLLYTGDEYIAIDAPEGFYDFVDNQEIKPSALLLTHQHYDHVEDAAKFAKAGVPIYAYEDYSPDLIMEDLAQKWGMNVKVEPFKVTNSLKNREIVRIGKNSVCVIHVPGHSPDSVVLYFPGKLYLFAGDTLFNGSVGRTDLPGGDHDLLIEGIRDKMLVLNKEIEVFPGHGDRTMIGVERDSNPFFSHMEIHTEGGLH